MGGNGLALLAMPWLHDTVDNGVEVPETTCNDSAYCACDLANHAEVPQLYCFVKSVWPQTYELEHIPRPVRCICILQCIELERDKSCGTLVSYSTYIIIRVLLLE